MDAELHDRFQRTQVAAGRCGHARDAGQPRGTRGIKFFHQVSGALAEDGAGHRAKIHQHWPVVGQEQDVVWRHVSMHVAGTVQGAQRTEQRVEQRAQRSFIRCFAHAAPHGEQGLTGVVRHDAVRRAIGLPDAVHTQQRRVIAARQNAGLVDERQTAAFEGVGMRRVVQLDLQTRAMGGQRGRQVLLEHHREVECQVAGQIDDAIATVAQHAFNLELFEPRSWLQRASGLRESTGRQRGGVGVEHGLRSFVATISGSATCASARRGCSPPHSRRPPPGSLQN